MIHIKNKGKSVNVRDLVHLRPTLLGDIAKKQARNFPDKEALVDIAASRRFTYKEFNDRINPLALALEDAGIKKGDVVCVVSRNSYKFLEVCFAIWKLRAIAFLMNWRLSLDEMVGALERVEPQFVLIGNDFAELYDEYSKATFVNLDQKKEGMYSYEEMLNRQTCKQREAELEERDIRPGDEYEVSTILLTGGTTGIPKAVAMSHKAVLSSATSWAIYTKHQGREARMFTAAPLFHAGGLILAFLSTFFRGGTTVIVPAGVPFEEWLRIMQDEKITLCMAIATMINRFLGERDLVKKYDLSNFKGFVDGGEPHDPQKRREIMEFLNCNITNGGGTQTEGCACGRLMNYEDYPWKKEPKYLESFGVIDPMWCETEVFDENDNPVREKEGEFVIRGEHMMSFFWGDEERTRQKIKSGWLRTDDLGVRFEDGRQEYTGRKSDLIISGGENVYATEIEQVIEQHPAVTRAAVFGVPDNQWGERITATVALKESASISEEELIEFIKSKIARFKAPKQVVFVDEVPTTALGKTQRVKAREIFMQQRER